MQIVFYYRIRVQNQLLKKHEMIGYLCWSLHVFYKVFSLVM